LNLAIFDLDHTLLPLDSDYTWTQFYVSQCPAKERKALLAINDELMRKYEAGTLDADHSLNFMLGLLARRPRAQLDAWHREFMRKVIEPAMTDAARELIESHRAQGHHTVISTATNRFVTMPIAGAFGVDTLIATEPEENAAGEFSGRWVGTPNFQAGKLVRMQQWLQTKGKTLEKFRRTFFYSDSINDVPLLERVTDPVATNPSPALETVARERGWKIIRLFT
jgi:HAD superfamily hydrolase (TIGR01490 family)